MIDLSTSFGGLKLKTPLIVSSSGLSTSLDRIRKMEAAGAGAVVLKSLFEEQIMYEVGAMESTDYPEAGDYLKTYARDNSLQDYLGMLHGAKEAVDMPVVASINCMGASEWVDFARRIADAGADALELNIYFLPLDKAKDPRTYEQAYLDLVSNVKAVTSLPLFVKLGNRFSSIPWMVHQLHLRGASAVTLFNRFYHPDIDTETMSFGSAEVLSTPADARYPLRWMGIVSSQVPEMDLAASTGIHSGLAAVKQILAGARAAQVCSVLYRNGIGYLSDMVAEMKKWMEKHRHESLDEFRGLMNYSNLDDPGIYERSQFMKYFSQMH